MTIPKGTRRKIQYYRWEKNKKKDLKLHSLTNIFAFSHLAYPENYFKKYFRTFKTFHNICAFLWIIQKSFFPLPIYNSFHHVHFPLWTSNVYKTSSWLCLGLNFLCFLSLYSLSNSPCLIPPPHLVSHFSSMVDFLLFPLLKSHFLPLSLLVCYPSLPTSFPPSLRRCCPAPIPPSYNPVFFGSLH